MKEHMSFTVTIQTKLVLEGKSDPAVNGERVLGERRVDVWAADARQAMALVEPYQFRPTEDVPAEIYARRMEDE